MVTLENFKQFVTDAEARRADGTTDPKSQYASWVRSNPGEVARWNSFRDAILAGKSPLTPAMSTPHGRELVDAGIMYLLSNAPVTPPAATGFVTGVSGGLNPSLAQSVPVKAFRDGDSSQFQSLYNWAVAQGANGAKSYIVCGNDLGTATKYSKASYFLPLNEPWFENRFGLEQMAKDSLAWGKQVKSAIPGAKLLFPMNTAVNNGDAEQSNGVWAPYSSIVLGAAPEIKTVFDGWCTHPYSPSPNMVLVDRVHDQLVAAGFDKECHFTEIGWSINGSYPSVATEALQAQYHQQMISMAKQRPWVHGYLAYCLQDVSTFPGWGMYDANGKARAAAAVVFGAS